MSSMAGPASAAMVLATILGMAAAGGAVARGEVAGAVPHDRPYDVRLTVLVEESATGDSAQVGRTARCKQKTRFDTNKGFHRVWDWQQDIFANALPAGGTLVIALDAAGLVCPRLADGTLQPRDLNFPRLAWLRHDGLELEVYDPAGWPRRNAARGGHIAPQQLLVQIGKPDSDHPRGRRAEQGSYTWISLVESHYKDKYRREAETVFIGYTAWELDPRVWRDALPLPAAGAGAVQLDGTESVLHQRRTPRGFGMLNINTARSVAAAAQDWRGGHPLRWDATAAAWVLETAREGFLSYVPLDPGTVPAGSKFAWLLSQQSRLTDADFNPALESERLVVVIGERRLALDYRPDDRPINQPWVPAWVLDPDSGRLFAIQRNLQMPRW